jgi:site-specific DNA-methyltransferase (adenine-specific)
MTCTILHGDCREVMAGLEPESVDLVLTDCPYQATSLRWDRWQTGWPAAARRVLKKTGSMWAFGSMRMFWDRKSEFDGWRLSQDTVWEKQNGTGFQKDRFKRVHELAVHFYRDDAAWADVYKCPQFTNDATARQIRRKRRPAHMGNIDVGHYVAVDGGPRMMRSVMHVRSEHGRALHPTQKPLGIVEPLLLYSCPPGGIVLDCFAGSGTTAIAAKRHGRRCILIESDPKFLEIATKRVANDGFQFAEVPA